MTKYRSPEHTIRDMYEASVIDGRKTGSRSAAFRRSSTSMPDDWRDKHGTDVGAARNDAHQKASYDKERDSENAKQKEVEKRSREAEQRKKETMNMAKEETEASGTVKRRKIENVARPDDPSPTSSASKLPKQAEIKTKVVDEAMKPAKRFVYDKPSSSIVNSYADRSTEDLQGMHDRWRKDHESSSRVDINVSDKLLAAHHVLKKRGVDVPDLPKHKNLGMSRTVSEDSRRVPMMKSDANFGLPRSVIEAAKSVMNGKTEVDTAPKTNDTDVDESKKKNLAALAHPKDKITKKDVLVGRGVLAKEEKEDDDKEPFEGPYKKVDATKSPSRSHLKSMTKKSREDAEKTTKEDVEFSDDEISRLEEIAKQFD